MSRQWSRTSAELLILGLFAVLLQTGAFASDDEEAQMLRQSSVGSLLSQHNKGNAPGASSSSPVARPSPPGTSSGAPPGHAGGGRTSPAPLRDDGKSIHLFGTLEMRSKIGNLPKWTSVLGREQANPGFTDNRSFPGQGAWKEIRARLAQASVLDKAKAVNTLINRWPYRTDMDVWGVVDYWEAPVDFFQKSGDCEDFAITKYFALRSLGVPASQMRVVILKDTLRNVDHAVTVVYTEGDAWTLDNLSNTVMSHKRLSHYRPQFSVNEEYRWAHMSPAR